MSVSMIENELFSSRLLFSATKHLCQTYILWIHLQNAILYVKQTNMGPLCSEVHQAFFFFLGLTESTFIFTEQRSAGRVFCLSLVILYHRIYRVLDIQVCKHILLKISTEVTARAPHCCQILTCTTWPECVKPSVLQRLHSLSQSQLLLPSKAAVNGPQSLFSGFRSACTIHLLLRNHRGVPSTEILDSSIMRRSTTLKQLTFLNVLLGAWHGFGFASGRVTHSQMKQE